MSPISSISLDSHPHSGKAKVTQLYRYLELYSEEEPAHHSLFVFAPGSGPLALADDLPNDDQLLIIDPPNDFENRFRLGNQVAVLYTGKGEPSTVPLVQTVAGGVAHLRIGEHFLDIYSQESSNIIHLPAMGLICSGDFGSDATVPHLAERSDGTDELETLRLLARLIKQHRLDFFLPRVGKESTQKVEVMQRLAEDVAYLHAMKRVITPLALRGESMEAVSDLAEDLLPSGRRTEFAMRTHQLNVTTLAGSVLL